MSRRSSVHRNREYIRRIKRRYGCTECGYKGPPEAMHFDHLDRDQKLYKVSHAASLSRKNLKEEVRKCVLLCANCHSIKTHQNKDWTNDRNSGKTLEVAKDS